MNKNLARQPCVYGLRAGAVYGYVGKTTVNTKTRLYEHMSRARLGHAAPVYDWIRSVGIEAIEIVELDADVSRETFWITKLLAEGHPLANQAGRDGRGGSWSSESKDRLSAAMSGKEPWIKGRTGEAAGWTDARRAAQSARIAAINTARRQ